eukprot:g3846.t1
MRSKDELAVVRKMSSLWAADRDGESRLKYLAFGSTMLASAALHDIFATYYLDFFLTVVHVDSRAFYIAQLIFMVWNALNDLVFGWLSDKITPMRHGRRDRLPIIRRGGLGWCVAFCLVWWPWTDGSAGTPSVWLTSLNFAFVLCLYDGMLTLVEVNHSALLADITVDSNQRAKYNMYSAFCAAVGSFSSFFGHMFWDKSNMAGFRVFVLVLGVISWVCFEFTAAYLGAGRSNPKYAALKAHGDGQDAFAGGGDGLAGVDEAAASGMSSVGVVTSAPSGAFDFARQLWRHKNLKVFLCMFALQQFDCAFGKNFFPIFLEKLVGDSLPASVRSLTLSASFILPWVSTIWLTSFVRQRGLHAAIAAVLHARAAVLVSVLLLLSVTHLTGWAGALALLLNRVVSEALCRLLPLVQSDLVDEDMYIHSRKSSMSASVIGAIGFFGKPSQSLAPMAGFAIMAGAVSAQGGGD